MATKSKSFRLTEDVADTFAEHCQKCGVVQERCVEALMVHAIVSCNAQALGKMIDDVAAWLARPQDQRQAASDATSPDAGANITMKRRQVKAAKKKATYFGRKNPP